MWLIPKKDRRTARPGPATLVRGATLSSKKRVSEIRLFVFGAAASFAAEAYF